MRLVSATANAHKLDEIRDILGPGVTVESRPPDVPDVVEDADTLAGNAELKVAAIVAATGRAAVADDTGLEVDALDGAPGVRSARFAGDDADDAANVRLLLDRLADAGAEDRAARTARFRTVALVGWPDGARHRADGVVEGWITGAPRGDGGFGYDPVFVPTEGDGRTFAEMSPDEKHALSHRGRAFGQLRHLLDPNGGAAATETGS